MPRVRTDIVDVYVFRRTPRVELLQLMRTGEPMVKTWQPVMGHIEEGESAAACALREIEEEVGLRDGDPALIGMWALEQVHPYYIAELDSIVMSPRFALEVAPGWKVKLNAEHSADRWIAAEDAEKSFMWPGQVATIREITESLLRPGSLSFGALRVK